MDMMDNIRYQGDIIYFDMNSDVTVVKFVIPLGFADLIQKTAAGCSVRQLFFVQFF